MPTTRQGLSSAAIEQLIAQHVADVIAAYKANRSSGNGIQNEASGSAGGVEHTAHGCSYKEFLNCKPQNFDRTEGAVGLTRWFEKMEYVFRICNCVEIAKQRLTNDIHGKVTSLKTTRIQEAIRMAHDLMDQVQQNKRNEVLRVYAVGSSDKKGYAGTLPLYDQCEFHHHGPCQAPCENCKKVGHETRDC
ncbi:reverse transcriptase domain-containing protein [Tanacetum coccineum]